MPKNLTVKLKRPHPMQEAFINSDAKRKVIRAGRRGGKTTGMAILAIKKFLEGKRVLYATPTQDQIGKFWSEITAALHEPIDNKVFVKNETMHTISVADSFGNSRIRAKTAWNADTLRGDFADELILDEYQLMDENAWDEVGAPMLADNNGNATFIYTEKRGKSHAKELYKKAKEDQTGRYQVFTFSSFANPHVSKEALEDLAKDMTAIAYKAEIMAEEIDDDPDALWKRDMIQYKEPRELKRIVIGVDPSGSSSGDECGIVAAGIDHQGFAYVLEDESIQASPKEWGQKAVNLYNRLKADRLVAEENFGGEMVKMTVHVLDKDIAYKAVHATRGKALRAEPIVAKYEQGKVYHCKGLTKLEDELCNWVPGIGKSPNRLDAMVWALTELLFKDSGGWVI